MKKEINRTLGNSLRCILPSFWWKRLLGKMVDKIESAEESAASASRIAMLAESEAANKQDMLVSGSNIKTINYQSILGSGNIIVDTDKVEKYKTKDDLDANGSLAGGDITAIVDVLLTEKPFTECYQPTRSEIEATPYNKKFTKVDGISLNPDFNPSLISLNYGSLRVKLYSDGNSKGYYEDHLSHLDIVCDANRIISYYEYSSATSIGTGHRLYDSSGFYSSNIDIVNNILREGDFRFSYIEVTYRENVSDSGYTCYYSYNDNFPSDATAMIDSFVKMIFAETQNADIYVKSAEWVKLLKEGDVTGGGADITIDSELSDTSENPVQNKVVTEKLEEIETSIAKNTAQIGQISGDVGEVSGKLTELSAEIYTEQEEKLPLNDGRYFNGMNVKVGNTFTAEDGTSASGVACRKFSVKAGEKYRLVGRYNYYAYKGYWITDANNVVTRMIADGESYDLELVIEGNESTLYVNCIGYNDEVDGVWKTTLVPIGDILEDVVSEVGELSEKVDNIGELEFSENTILDAEIVDGYAYNIGGKKVGEYFTSIPTQYAGYAYLRVLIDPSNTYAIKGVGSPYSFRYFAFLDKNLKILTIAAGQDYDTRNEPIVLTPPTDAAILIVNFMGYNAETDGVTCTENYSIKTIKDASQSEWGGKTIVTFGDSITQFEDANFMSWPQWLQHYTKANVINVGIGGTQLKVRATPSSSPTSDNQAYAGVDVCSLVEAATSQDFAIVSASAEYIQTNLSPINSVTDAVNRLQSIDWQKVDAAVIFAGTNDWYNGGGAIGTTGSQDEKTTLGAINKIIELINSTYPHVQLYWFTPIVRYIGAESAWNDANWGGNLEVSGNTLIEVVDLIKREVENNNIPICDLYRTLGWNKHNFKYYFNSGDGTHPNRGLRFIAQKVMSFMESNKTFL